MQNHIPEDAFLLTRTAGYRGSIMNVLQSILSLSRQTGYCWASNETLAADCHITVGHLRRLTKQLKRDGAIRKQRTGRANHTTIDFDQLRKRSEMIHQREQKCSVRLSRNDPSERAEMIHLTEQKCTPTKHVLNKETKQMTDNDPNNAKAAPAVLTDRLSKVKTLIDSFNALPSINQYVPPNRYWKGDYPQSSIFKTLVEFTENSDWEAQWNLFTTAYKKSSFLQSGGQQGNLNNINWLFKPANFEKVVTGQYANKQSQQLETFQKPITDSIDLSADDKILAKYTKWKQ
jgi:hypothetical protein